EQHQAGNQARVGITGDVVIALDAVGAAQNGGMRPPAVPQEFDDGHHDGEPDARDRAQHRHADEADDRQPELPALDAPDAARRAASPAVRRRAGATTTAARAGVGKWRSRLGAASSKAATPSAPMIPVSWVFAPDASATGVRDELLLIGKPRKKPAARLAAPSPTISWLGLTYRPRRAASARDNPLVSAKQTSAPAAPPTTTGPRSSTPIQGMLKPGRPCGREPRTATLARADKSKAPAMTVAPTTAINTPGNRLLPLNSRMVASVAAPSRKEARF